jgi:hypothetical protein
MRLLQYNPNVVTHESNFHLPGIEKFSKFFKIYNPTVVVLDRSNTIRIPVYTTLLFPLPVLRPISKSFEEICNDRAIELLTRADSLGVTVYVFYSGGIDSTLLLISLLKQATPVQKANIVVLLSEDSIRENPNFYREFIHGKLRVDSVNQYPYLLGSNALFVGGEHNDQLFGSDMMGKLITRFDPSVIQKRYDRDLFFTFFNGNLDDSVATHFYLDMFERLKAAAPVNIVTNHDYLWWINFSLKWQSVFMRMLTCVAPRNATRIDLAYLGTRYNHFYGTEDFQLWSMNNMDKKIKNSWNTYKWVCKDIIYDYTKDADYRDNKIKVGSLSSVIRQQIQYNFIDDSMTFSREMSPQEYYNPNNDFA